MGMFDSLVILNDITGDFKCKQGHSLVTKIVLNPMDINKNIVFQTKDLGETMGSFFIINGSLHKWDSPANTGIFPENNDMTIVSASSAFKLEKHTGNTHIHTDCPKCIIYYKRHVDKETWTKRAYQKDYCNVEFDVYLKEGKIDYVNRTLAETIEDAQKRVQNYSNFECLSTKEEYNSHSFHFEDEF